MNPKHPLALLVAALLSTATLVAKPIPGPKGGRLLTTAAPHTEFFVDADRHVVLTFYTTELQPTPLSGQVATATVEAPSGKTRLEFAAQEGVLVSTTPLPAGDGYRVVVQLKADAAAKPANYRLEYHAEVCAECHRAEYACTCDDAGGDHRGHAH